MYLGGILEHQPLMSMQESSPIAVKIGMLNHDVPMLSKTSTSPNPVTNTGISVSMMRADCANSRMYTPYTRLFKYTWSLGNAM
jgi:hypothetical protein